MTRALSLALALVAQVAGAQDFNAPVLGKALKTCSSGAVISRCKCGAAHPRTGYCCSGVAQATGCHLIDDDANTICHPWWDGAQIQDTKGCVWVKVGNPTMVPASGQRPAGASGWSGTKYYRTSAVNDALDFAGDFTAVVVYSAPSLDSSGSTMFEDGTPPGTGTKGYAIKADRSTNGPFFYSMNGSAHYVQDSGSAETIGNLSVVCFGRAGTNGVLKVRTRTTVTTGVGSAVADTTDYGFIGIDQRASGDENKTKIGHSAI